MILLFVMLDENPAAHICSKATLRQKVVIQLSQPSSPPVLIGHLMHSVAITHRILTICIVFPKARDLWWMSIHLPLDTAML